MTTTNLNKLTQEMIYKNPVTFVEHDGFIFEVSEGRYCDVKYELRLLDGKYLDFKSVAAIKKTIKLHAENEKTNAEVM